MPNIESVLISHDIKYWTEGKNVTPGWLNIRCPFCGDMSNHGGFNLETGAYNCWRCGGEHTADEVMKELTGADVHLTFGEPSLKKKAKRETVKKYYEDMPGDEDLMDCHKQYLLKRGLDPTIIQELYRIKGTSYKPLKYQWRIMIPIFSNEMEYLGFQGRDITGKQRERYSCESDTDNKKVLYGEWLIKDKDNIMVVEGVFDAWKLGAGAICTFGIAYTRRQIKLLSEYKNVYIMFDNEKRAQAQAKKLCEELSVIDVNAKIIRLPDKYKDAGEMPTKEARELKDKTFNQ